jgi:putative transposase
MADRPRMTAAQLGNKLLVDEHPDVLRDSAAWMAAELMEAEVAAQIGAELGERTSERLTHRNGYRPRRWDTRVGELELAIPRLRQGSYFPSFLEPRRRAEQALVAVVQEAYVNGVSTRKVDRLVEQLGLHHLSKDQVSRRCRGLDEQVRMFCERPLEGAYPYLWLDAKVERVREPGGVGHKALVIAYGVHQTGRREVIGIDVGEAETEAFWREFLRGLRARGLAGVRLCVSEGLKQANRQGAWLPVATVHRPVPPRHARACRQGPAAHDRRGHPRHLPGQQPGRGARAAGRGRCQARRGRGQGRPPAGGSGGGAAGVLPAASRALVQAQEHQSAGARQPRGRPPNRRGRELPQRRHAAAPAGMLLIEQNDEWLVARRYLSQESLALVLDPEPDDPATQEVAQLTPA